MRETLDVGLGVCRGESSKPGKLLREPFNSKATCVIFITDKHAQIQHAGKSRKCNETKWRTDKEKRGLEESARNKNSHEA